MQNIPPEFEIQVGALVREATSLAQSLALAMVKEAFEASGAVIGTGAKPAAPSRPGTKRSRLAAKPTARRKPRSSAEIAGLGEKFVAEVRAHPGESMTTLSAHVGVSPRDLGAVVSRLKREEKVRVIGRRGSARYFPATETAAVGEKAEYISFLFTSGVDDGHDSLGKAVPSLALRAKAPPSPHHKSS